ncbi:hypothetical protein FHS14_004661 [Paenibacillus baekrokdamisoli]|uniref:hypothetical protein n=1 Tax=Paenibacillus baekrokdamisoli TaxID=1712516 RepID=UPI000F777A92|nr:hypothetical protein [Paenibacillus baekrokdamisoli]MBB3071652.1 hypothetical protein [Paenibacillus baekrokdamisoli]
MEHQLLYRRQFIMGPRSVALSGWKTLDIDGKHYLTIHPDLQFEQTTINNGIQLTLLGYIIDPYHPNETNMMILNRLQDNLSSFEELTKRSEPYGGRWIIIHRDNCGVRLFHDPCGLRQIHYMDTEEGLWCASQAIRLAEILNIKEDNDASMQQFMHSPQFESEERAWAGEGSPYKGINHLIPNHYLDLNRVTVHRYWPYENLKPLAIKEAVVEAAALLRGSVESIAQRYKVMIPVTAGWESRSLLAASKNIKNKVYYYIGKHEHLSDESQDVRVPAKLLKRLGLEYHVDECKEEMDESFKNIYNRNVTMARHLPKSLIIYRHYKHTQDRINICGICSEIAKKCVYTHHYARHITPELLAKVFKYKNMEYPTAIYARWLEQTEDIAKRSKINIFDLFYWEMRMGNWGAMYAAEQDIAVEEFCPFNNRKLLTILLSVPEKYRIPPNFTLYREIVKSLWEQTLIEPVNPPTLKSLAKRVYRGVRRNTLYITTYWQRKPNYQKYQLTKMAIHAAGRMKADGSQEISGNYYL